MSWSPEAEQAARRRLGAALAAYAAVAGVYGGFNGPPPELLAVVIASVAGATYLATHLLADKSSANQSPLGLKKNYFAPNNGTSVSTHLTAAVIESTV